ncbi:hypothetical protein DJ018_13210 [Phenylobacterium deserti]|uniref:Uncharacterized protein n=1 Tax=Phenylobacterium deserti TaxID=1914756 RepID=A0A328AGY1_9CAUL|nr:hypothetical protein DJ018_13210 [Phenylobacterium deserti]
MRSLVRVTDERCPATMFSAVRVSQSIIRATVFAVFVGCSCFSHWLTASPRLAVNRKGCGSYPMKSAIPSAMNASLAAQGRRTTSHRDGLAAMEVGTQCDALIARDRLLTAMSQSEDVFERVSLWRAAARFNRKHRESLHAGGNAQALAGPGQTGWARATGNAE